jgi:Kiwa KwaB-like protein
MANKNTRKLAQLHQTDFKPWTTTLWLVKRRLDVERSAHYSVLRVDIDKKLQNKLKKAVADRIQGSTYKLEEYEFLTSDQDDRLFTIESADTDFAKIQAEVDQGLANNKVDKYEDLLDSWAYVVKLDHDGKAVYGMRKVNKFTRATKVKAVSYFLFEDKRLVDLEDKQIFTLDTHIDFFAYDGTTFIANKKEFESALNFREGMEKNRDAILGEFVSLKVVIDVEPIRKFVGSNLHLLRKISMIQKSGYYKDKSFLEDLIKKNVEKGWNLKVERGAIVVDDSNVDLVLKLLNNERVESQINQEVFDAIIKKKVI